MIDWEGAVSDLRPGLVRRARCLGADAATAEDLAQEALAEAWRCRARVYDATRSGMDAWLAAILGNVWRRYLRRQARHPRPEPLEAQVTPEEPADLEVELDRRELAELLDRALALLPAESRQVLVHRFVEDTPLREVANRLGLSEGAVKMRVQRGKLALHRVLSTEYRDEAVSFGLFEAGDAGWVQTPLWCWLCGSYRLEGRFRGVQRDVEFRCPGCTPPGSDYLLSSEPATARLGLRTFRAIWRKIGEDSWLQWHGKAGVGPEHLRPLRLDRRLLRLPAGGPLPAFHWVEAKAFRGPVTSSTSLPGLAWVSPTGRQFQQDHPRVRLYRYDEVETAGVPAVHTGFEAVPDGARLDVVLTRDTFQLLDARTH